MFRLTNTRKLDNGKEKRTYREEETNTEIYTIELYTDKQGNRWFAFEDLYQMPFARHFAAKKVIDLYGAGLSLDDVRAITKQLKVHLKGNDPDKYEKAMTEVLRLEQLSEAMADPVKQSLGLCTVYLLLDKEQIDVYSQDTMNYKMSLLAMDLDAQAFFLQWWIAIIPRYTGVLKGLSQIASSVSQLVGTTAEQSSTSKK